MEWGNFGELGHLADLQTEYDQKLDAGSNNPGKQLLVGIILSPDLYVACIFTVFSYWCIHGVMIICLANNWYSFSWQKGKQIGIMNEKYIRNLLT